MRVRAMGDASREPRVHDCGSIEDMRPINELRMKARWKLGGALAEGRAETW
jgi:hypothetical protein